VLKDSRSSRCKSWSSSGAQYRLRIDQVRVFYDVVGSSVEVLAIVNKSGAESWLDQFGSPE